MKVATFRDLMNGHAKAEIYCLYRGTLVRKLTVGPNVVVIDPTGGAPFVTVPADTPIEHVPWVFDRGNLVFPTNAVIETGVLPPACPPELKICGEGDTITFSDGTTDRVYPAEPRTANFVRAV